MIATASPGVLIWCVQQSDDLGSCQERDEFLLVALVRNGQYPLDHRRCCGLLKRRVAEERADRGLTQIAAAGAIAARLLQIIKEGPDQRRVHLGQGQGRRLLAQPLARELQQQAERIAIGADRVRACSSLGHEALGEEVFQQHREADSTVPGQSSHRRCRRWVASPINSGQADRYQYVSVTWAWPK